jgi:hypothetical protein
MMFCLDDGAELLYGPAVVNESATAILPTFKPAYTDSSAQQSISGLGLADLDGSRPDVPRSQI